MTCGNRFSMAPFEMSRALPPLPPAPLASSAAVRIRMKAQGRRDTKPELAIRSLLHRMGLRFYVECPVIKGSRRRADVVFPRQKVAVWVDGCFWHGCPDHARLPATNSQYWRTKIERNKLRDSDTDERLSETGWVSIRIWEHENPTTAALAIATVVKARRLGH